MAATSSGLASRGDRKKRPKKFLCGTPLSECCGSYTTACNSLKKGIKTHTSPADSVKCYGKYLIRQGYQQIGPREFVKGDEPIIVLNKKSKGNLLRGGKGSRYMGKHRAGHITSI